MWPSIDNQPHSAFENVHDLLVRMSMLRHFTAGFETRDHLVHGLTTRNGLAFNAGTNFDPGILFSLFCHGSTMNRSGRLRSIALPILSGPICEDSRHETGPSRLPSYQRCSCSRERAARGPRITTENEFPKISRAEYIRNLRPEVTIGSDKIAKRPSFRSARLK